MNDGFVQVSGPFSASQDIINYIKTNYNADMSYIKTCGIQAPIGDIIYVNGVPFEIGKTGILEFRDVRITSLYFGQNESNTVFIDCIII